MEMFLGDSYFSDEFLAFIERSLPMRVYLLPRGL
jgi:hypothetical protein